MLSQMTGAAKAGWPCSLTVALNPAKKLSERSLSKLSIVFTSAGSVTFLPTYLQSATLVGRTGLFRTDVTDSLTSVAPDGYIVQKGVRGQIRPVEIWR